MPRAAPPVPEKCSTCGMEFNTRNKLFKHLREPNCFVEVKPPPSEADGDAGSRPKRRLVLACGFVGDAFPGVGRTLEEDAAANQEETETTTSPLDSRPSLETILTAAVNSACGYDAVISFDPAVTTEKGESASRNVLVFGLVKLKPGAEAGNEGPADGSPLPPAFLEALQSAMPPQVWLLQPPRLLPPNKRALAGVARSVACQSHAFAIPYSCLIPPASASGSLPLPSFDIARAVQASDADGVNRNENKQPGSINENDLFLTGYPEDTTTVQVLVAAINDAYRVNAAAATKDIPAAEAGATPEAIVTMYKGGWCTVVRRDGQSFSDDVLALLNGRTLDATTACAQEKLHNQEDSTANEEFVPSKENSSNLNAPAATASSSSSSSPVTGLIALRWHEARVKLAIWAKLKHGLKILSTGRGFQNFLKPGSVPLNRGMKLFVNGHVDSKVVLRSALDDNSDNSNSSSGSNTESCPAPPSWLAREWCVIIFDGPRTLGCELLRRLAGTLVAYCRGTENESYLLRCHSNTKSGAVTTPRAPTSSMCLIGFELDPIRRGQGGREAASLRCQGDDDAVEVAAWAARGCGNGGGSTIASEESSSGAAVLAACLTRQDARKAWESMCASIDSGEATRGADNARLREASRTGDMRALATFLAVNVPGGAESVEVESTSGSSSTSVPLYSSIDARDEYGRTALFLAAQNGHSKAVEFLLTQGARLAAAVAFGGCSALVAAQTAGHQDVVKILQDAAVSACADQTSTTSAAITKASVEEGFVGGPMVEATSSWRPEKGTIGYNDTDSTQSQLQSQLTGMSLQETTKTEELESSLVRELLPQRLYPGHPGCGSIEIDNAVTDQEALALITLWRDYLPEVPKAKPSCSARKYFADPDRWLNDRVQKAIERAYRNNGNSSLGSPSTTNDDESPAGSRSSNEHRLRVVVAPLVRFLCYSDAGGRLPAHVDLSRAVSLPPGCQLPPPPTPAPPSVETSPEASSSSSSSSSPVALNAGFVATRTGGLGDHGGGRQTVKPPPRNSNPSNKPPKENCNGGKPLADSASSAPTTHTFLLYLTDCPRGGTTDLLEALEGDAELAPRGGVVPGQRAVLATTQPMKGRLMLMPHACPHQASPVIDAPKLLIRGEALVFWETAETESN